MLVACNWRSWRRFVAGDQLMVDFFHWTHLGDWRFDEREWPDPEGMVAELAELGVKLMVSVWPTVNPMSENYRTMAERGLLVGAAPVG